MLSQKQIVNSLKAKLPASKNADAVLFVVLFGVVGTVLLFAAHAATNTGFSLSPQSGSISGNASVVADSTAVSGKAVEFGAKVNNSSGSTSSGKSTIGSGSTNGGGSTSGTGNSGGTGTSTDSITTSGTNLMQNGKVYHSIGFNFSPLGDCWDSNWSTAQMDTFFAALPSNSIARFFAPPDSTDSASFVESIVHEADKYNIHLIVALADADVDNNCDTENASNGGKTVAYYTDAPESGSTWSNWVKSVVTPLANDPGVAIWEIANEAFHNGASINQVGMTNAETYVNDAAADIRAAETAGAGSPKQLITIAPADIGEFGGVSGMEALYKNLDIIDDHDYSADADPGSPAVNTEFPELEQVGKALNKPYMVDEAGVEAGSSCSSATVYNAWDNGTNGLSLQGRVTFLVTDKATDYFKNGASAVAFWLYTGQGGGCSYENINTSDPIMAEVKNYVIP